MNKNYIKTSNFKILNISKKILLQKKVLNQFIYLIRFPLNLNNSHTLFL